MIETISSYIQNDPLFTLFVIPLLIGLFASFFVVIFYDFIIFRRFYLNLCREIDSNHNKIQPDEISIQFSQVRTKFENKLQNPNSGEWIGLGKKISIWILVQKTDNQPADYYRYLTSNDLKNFIQRGYYYYIKECEENLTLFYLDCENLSNRTQNHEKLFNYSPEILCPNYSNLTESQKRNCFEAYLMEIEAIISFYQHSIECRYSEIKQALKTDLFFVVRLYFSKNFF